MGKILASATALLSLLLIIVNNASASVGSVYRAEYESGEDSGTGTGSQFQMNAIYSSPTEGIGLSAFSMTSILSDVHGDGVVGPSEECDNGISNSDTLPNACRTNSVLPYCGDGVLDSGEQCEGGNLNGITTCSQLGYSAGTPSCGGGCVIIGCFNPAAGGSGSGGSGSGGGPAPSPAPLPKPLVVPPKPAPKEEPEQETPPEEKKPDEILISLKVYPEKRLPAQGNWANSYSISLRDNRLGTNTFQGSISTGNDGMGSMRVLLDPGSYTVGIKGMSHLRVVIPNVQIIEGVLIDATTRTIRAGDVQGDNFVNALDISRVVGGLYGSNTLLDLNRDGIVNALDLSILLSNLYKAGE